MFRTRRVLESAQAAIVTINGEQYSNFSSNDYLGLADSPLLKDAMKQALDNYGVGATSSQLISGHFDIHQQLEARLAAFLNRRKALVFTTGYQANLAIASALVNKDTIIIQDKLNHASLIDMSLLSRGRLIRFAHQDLQQLSRLLKKYQHQRVIVLSDGVFSMDGDYADVTELARLCRHYNALLMIDDAHGLGVLGDSGGGLLEQQKLTQQDVPLLMGTFAKAFGVSGAFVAGDDVLIEALLQKARTYIYTTAIMPAIAATIIKALELIMHGSALRQKLFNRVNEFKSSLQDPVSLPSSSHIQPFIIGDANHALSVSDCLYQNHILAPAIRPPTVSMGSARIRFSITAGHTSAQIKQLVNHLQTKLIQTSV